MRLKLGAFAMLAAVVAAASVFAATATPATSATNTSTVPITGTILSGGTFTGTFTITKFAVQNGQIVAVGTLTGTLRDAAGNVIGTVTNLPVTLPVTTGQSSCTILELTLGPLDLNLLGLMVHLDQVHLLITAEPGPGNLLGNLLCQIAGLLDNGASLNAVVDKLNQVLKRL
jgi:hypothetical protein